MSYKKHKFILTEVFAFISKSILIVGFVKSTVTSVVSVMVTGTFLRFSVEKNKNIGRCISNK